MNWIKTNQDLNELKAMLDYHIDEFRIEIETFWNPQLKTNYNKRSFFDLSYSVNALDVLCQFSAFLATNPSFAQINQAIKDLADVNLDQPLGWQKGWLYEIINEDHFPQTSAKTNGKSLV